MNGFAFATGGGIGGTILASYNAVDPVSATGGAIITPSKIVGGTSQSNCSFTRPNGSTQGFAALDFSLNSATTLAQQAVPPQAGCVDIDRSSGPPGSAVPSGTTTGPGIQTATGDLVYIPFALDAVTGATGPTTSGQTTTTKCVSTTTGCTNGTISFTVPVTNITQADLFTLNDLKTLYASCGTVTEGGVTYNPVTAGTGQQQIDLYVPQSGSGTLKFWASTLGFSPTTLPTCVHQAILAGPAVSVSVEEHDGSAVASDANGYMPFSIAQWIAQSHGIDERRHTAILHNINGISPFNGTKLNTAFPIIREVYNVMQYGAVVSGGVTGVTFDPVLSGLFATTTSGLCQNSFLIQNYGFATLPTTGGPTPDQCGATTSGLRVQQTNNGPG
jgi:phosphate transport system substrate-binding protein